MFIKFIHKYSEYSLLLVAGYLPPEGSAWGRDAVGFYANVLRTVYLYNSECDAIYFSGDLNSRFGLDLDFLPGIDDICSRTIIDKSKNKHGVKLLNFLLKSKMIVYNARLTTQFDNCTFIDLAKGSSVVEYFIVLINVLN